MFKTYKGKNHLGGSKIHTPTIGVALGPIKYMSIPNTITIFSHESNHRCRMNYSSTSHFEKRNVRTLLDNLKNL
jgi:hypothetical protein